jgi:hypothetical protein
MGALVLLAACGGGAVSTSSSDRPATTVATRARPMGTILPANPEIRQASARGPIEAITPEELAPGYPVSRVVLAGQAPVAERSFLIGLPAHVALPFAVGDSIVLSIETLPGPPTWQPRNIVVTTEGGELLATHGVLAPPGWSIERGGVVRRVDRGDYDEVDQSVAFGHGGQAAVTDGGQWRRLACPDGGWWVAGSATDLEGEMLPPDGGPAISIMIVRIR